MRRFSVTITDVGGNLNELVIPEPDENRTVESVADDINRVVGEARSMKIGTTVVYIPNVVTISIRDMGLRK